MMRNCVSRFDKLMSISYVEKHGVQIVPYNI